MQRPNARRDVFFVKAVKTFVTFCCDVRAVAGAALQPQLGKWILNYKRIHKEEQGPTQTVFPAADLICGAFRRFYTVIVQPRGTGTFYRTGGVSQQISDVCMRADGAVFSP